MVLCFNLLNKRSRINIVILSEIAFFIFIISFGFDDI